MASPANCTEKALVGLPSKEEKGSALPKPAGRCKEKALPFAHTKPTKPGASGSTVSKVQAQIGQSKETKSPDSLNSKIDRLTNIVRSVLPVLRSLNRHLTRLDSQTKRELKTLC